MVKQILGLVLLLAGIGASYLFAVPALAEVRELRNDAEVLGTLISKTEQLNAIGGAVIERFQAVSPADLSRVDALIPDQIDNVKLILEIQKLAEQYGLLVQQIDVSGTSQREVANQTLQVVSFSARILGPYLDFVDFLEQLELSQRLIDPNSISFQAIPNEVGYTYAISLDTYWKE